MNSKTSGKLSEAIGKIDSAKEEKRAYDSNSISSSSAKTPAERFEA
jgi:hypothetical protein